MELSDTNKTKAFPSNSNESLDIMQLSVYTVGVHDQGFLGGLASGKHPFPFRTRWLRLDAATIL
jgi:hypothetical protein